MRLILSTLFSLTLVGADLRADDDALYTTFGDGKTLHLVFSGEDSFSVRKATIRLVGPGR
jgi:hypothetical protein